MHKQFNINCNLAIAAQGNRYFAVLDFAEHAEADAT